LIGDKQGWEHPPKKSRTKDIKIDEKNARKFKNEI
jgi:hypothetical protein